MGGWRPGGCIDRKPFPSVALFSAILIFVRKNPGVRDFARNFFEFFRFQTGKDPAKISSRQLFLQILTFAPKIFRQKKFYCQKKSGFSHPGAGSLLHDLRRRSELVVELTPFFPTFAPTFFGFFNFQSKNFPAFQLSNRKKIGRKTFAVKKFSRTRFRTRNFWPEKRSGRTS